MVWAMLKSSDVFRFLDDFFEEVGGGGGVRTASGDATAAAAAPAGDGGWCWGSRTSMGSLTMTSGEDWAAAAATASISEDDNDSVPSRSWYRLSWRMVWTGRARTGLGSFRLQYRRNMVREPWRMAGAADKAPGAHSLTTAPDTAAMPLVSSQYAYAVMVWLAKDSNHYLDNT